jgi:serine/threonine protein phosphatase PrpC
VYFNGNKLYVANAGDSRSILISSSSSQSQPFEVKQLSRDHKPDLDDEKDRILSMKGRIKSFVDSHGAPLGPKRVWLPKEDIPGLAMSRSLGDRVAHSVGVSCEAEISEFALNEQSKILVLASDGVWEFLSNEEVAGTVIPFFDKGAPEAAANALVKVAI